MKKRLIFSVFVGLAFLFVMLIPCLTGCSYNKSIVDTDYGFKTAYVLEKGEWKEYSISKWSDYDDCDMVCIWTKDGKVIYSNSTNIVLKGEK